MAKCGAGDKECVLLNGSVVGIPGVAPPSKTNKFAPTGGKLKLHHFPERKVAISAAYR